MLYYNSGEAMEVGDIIALEGGFEIAEVIKILDTEEQIKDYNLSDYGFFVLSTRVDGVIYLEQSELQGESTILISRALVNRQDRYEGLI